MVIENFVKPIRNNSFLILDLAMEQVKKLIADNKVFVFAKSYCPYCKKAKEALASINVEFGLLDLDKYKTNV